MQKKNEELEQKLHNMLPDLIVIDMASRMFDYSPDIKDLFRFEVEQFFSERNDVEFEFFHRSDQDWTSKGLYSGIKASVHVPPGYGLKPSIALWLYYVPYGSVPQTLFQRELNGAPKFAFNEGFYFSNGSDAKRELDWITNKDDRTFYRRDEYLFIPSAKED